MLPGANVIEETIKSGTILIAEDARLPESTLLDCVPYVEGWKLVKNYDSAGIEEIINQAGWNFFYIAGAIETNAWGRDQDKTTRKAIRHLVTSLAAKKFNCLEVSEVTTKRSLGVPAVRVSARWRHIQRSIMLFGLWGAF